MTMADLFVNNATHVAMINGRAFLPLQRLIEVAVSSQHVILGCGK
jgi:hypothetical protein